MPTSPSADIVGTPGTLRGRSIVVARARPGPSAIAASLRALGAEVSEIPRVERELLPAPAALLEVIRGYRDGVVVVACEEAAHVVDRAFADAPNGSSPVLLAIGAGPAAILNRGETGPLALTSGACRAELAGLRAHVRDRRLVVAVSERGRPALMSELEHLGGRPELCVVATDVHGLPDEWPLAVDLVVLGSTSAARALYEHAPASIFRSTAVAIGAQTETTARALGVRTVVRASHDTREAVVATAMKLLGRAPHAALRIRDRTAGRTTVTSELRESEATTDGGTEPKADDRRGLLVVYTGNGKGKTTAALGMVFRALGRGLRVTVVQFIKGKWKTGERLFAETLPALRFHVMGLGFTWNSDDLSRDKAAARAAWDTASAELSSGERDLVVLDELTYAFHYGFLSLDEVLKGLRERAPHVHVVITGRNAPEELLTLADTVTEMAMVKHPFTSGEKARLGVDY